MREETNKPRQLTIEERLLGSLSSVKSNAAISKRFAELRAMGFDPNFGIYDEPWVRTLMFHFPLNAKAEKRLREDAKAVSGIRTKSEAEDFDRRLELWINQHYAKNWQEWQTRFPLVKFP